MGKEVGGMVPLGAAEGEEVGKKVGAAVPLLGEAVGNEVGPAEGEEVGPTEGEAVGNVHAVE